MRPILDRRTARDDWLSRMEIGLGIGEEEGWECGLQPVQVVRCIARKTPVSAGARE